MKSETAILFGAVIIGFVLVPPLARANAVLVNGFLFLILFSSLLLRRDSWLPHLSTVAGAVGGGGARPGSSPGGAPPASGAHAETRHR